LIVEDDGALRDVVACALESEGYVVATAEHGAAALDLLERELPCLILLDMRMPVMDGWTFARCYRERPGPHAPIVVVTAARDAAAWAQQIEAAGYLTKPFEITDLLGLVGTYVG
jgi:CheY-like chemotaxis protein